MGKARVVISEEPEEVKKDFWYRFGEILGVLFWVAILPIVFVFMVIYFFLAFSGGGKKVKGWF